MLIFLIYYGIAIGAFLEANRERANLWVAFWAAIAWPIPLGMWLQWRLSKHHDAMKREEEERNAYQFKPGDRVRILKGYYAHRTGMVDDNTRNRKGFVNVAIDGGLSDCYLFASECELLSEESGAASP